MTDKSKSSSRKKPVSQKRVAVVLTSLVATLTLSAGLLLIVEGAPLTATPQMLGRPQVAETQVPLQVGAWNYIIVYESGTLAGDAASLAEGRTQGGPSLPSAARPGANFHFVVDGARGVDGELRVGSAWLRQESGAPYAGWPDVSYYHYSPYNNAVGICLVGEVSRDGQVRPGASQASTATDLVRELQRKLNIPVSNVLFQWELEPNVSRMSASQKSFADNFRRGLE